MVPTPSSDSEPRSGESRSGTQNVAGPESAAILSPQVVPQALRRDGLVLLLLGCAIFILVGTGWMCLSRAGLLDFRTAYASARSLVRHSDPYDPDKVLRIYRAEGGAQLSDTARDLLIVTRNVYLPSEFAVTLLFALLPFAPAQILWSAVIAAGCILAAVLLWQSAAGYAPILAGALLCLFLINSASLILGNPSGLAVSLCAIAAWCLIRQRFAFWGALALGVSLALKPHDAGFVWLYFLLIGGTFRKRALQSVALAVGMGLLMVFLIARVSPHWLSEMHANLAAFTHRGGINDPGPATGGGRGLYMITDLQAVFSFVKDDPHFYNFASLAVCVPLLGAWIVVTLRSRFSTRSAWLALAAAAVLTMLPSYHRQYDAKLILLTIPACAILWTEGGRIGRYALLLTALAIALNGDFTWLLLYRLIATLHLSTEAFYAAAPVPLSLLALGVFYLWVYARSLASDRVLAQSGPAAPSAHAV